MEKIEKTIIQSDIAMSLPRNILILGLGYTMYHLAVLCLQLGMKVTVSCRSELKRKLIARSLKQVDIISFENALTSSMSQSKLLEAISCASAIISSIPPNREDLDVSLYFIKKALDNGLDRKKWFGYLSATSVYGNHDDLWVNEASVCQPQSIRGKRRHLAEAEWIKLSHSYNISCNIFRLPGIYGKNRSVIEKLQNKQCNFVDKRDHLFCRIHVIDIVRAICHSMARDAQTDKLQIYNVSDDQPATLFEIYNYATFLLGLSPAEPQSFANANLTKMQKSFYTDKRKIDNKKLKQKLNFELLYPTYKEGLRGIVAQYCNYPKR